MKDQHELMFKTIGEPYMREWSTATCDEHGNMPPFDSWQQHSCEVVIIETSVLKQAVEALQFYANPDNYTHQEKLSGKNWLMVEEGVEGVAVEVLKFVTKQPSEVKR